MFMLGWYSILYGHFMCMHFKSLNPLAMGTNLNFQYRFKYFTIYKVF